MSHWFRFYDEVVEDPKVQRLPLPLFKFWVNAMCLASRNGGDIPSQADMAFSLRMPEKQVAASLKALIAAGLMDTSDGTVTPHNWSGRQYESDSAAERMRKYRANKKRNALRNGDVLDTEQIQSRTETDTVEDKSSTGEVAGVVVDFPGKPASDKPDWWPRRDRYGRVLGETTDKVLYQVGKAVLGNSAGGQITKLRKLHPYRFDLRAAIELLLRADDTAEPQAWFATALKNAEIDEPLDPKHVVFPENIYGER